MLKDPKAQSLVDNFASQRFQTRALAPFTPDRTEFPDFDEELRNSMKKETELFFSHVMTDDYSILDFLASDYSWVNERLAPLRHSRRTWQRVPPRIAGRHPSGRSR